MRYIILNVTFVAFTLEQHSDGALAHNSPGNRTKGLI